MTTGTFGLPGGELRLFRAGRAPGDAGAMNARLHQPSASPAGSAIALYGAAAHQGPGDRACCCVARAVVRVVMPPAPGRPHETELLLCGHHYRVSRPALLAAHAQVYELPGPGADATAWYHDDHDRLAHPAVVG